MFKINYKWRHRWLNKCFVYFKHGNIFPSSAYLCKPSFFDSIRHAWTCLPIKSHSISPSWHTVKVRVQGSRACVHTAVPFSFPIPLFFLLLTVPEWREAPQRSWTWISFGLTLWKGQRRAPWNGSEAFTSLSQEPQLLHQPWNGKGWKHSRDTLTRTRKVPLSFMWPHLVPNWPKCLFKSVHRVQQQSGLNHHV